MRLHGSYTLPGVACTFNVPKHFIAIEQLKEAMKQDEPVYLLSYDFHDEGLEEVDHDIGMIVKVHKIEEEKFNYKISLIGVSQARLQAYDEQTKTVLQWEQLAYEQEDSKLLLKQFKALVNRLEQYALFMNSLSAHRLYEKYAAVEVEKLEHSEQLIYLLNRMTMDLLEETDANPIEYQSYLESNRLSENILNIYEKLYRVMVEAYNERYSFPEYEEEIPSTDLSNQEEQGKEISKEMKEVSMDMKAIKEKLNEQLDELQALELKMIEKGMPKDTLRLIQEEIQGLKREDEHSKARIRGVTYLKTVANLPWSNERKEHAIKKAKHILDSTHYGMDEVKNEIVKFLAERALNKDAQGVVLCLVGPPGVGKTSLVRTVAKATNREFIQMKLGGVSDEAIIRGFPRSYANSMPGVLIQEMEKVDSINPVILLDEIDKLSHHERRGDVGSALLEILDPSQNSEFRDHYLSLPYDLSQCLFIATANYLEQIPSALKDRMEVVHLTGYTPEEKLTIAQQYILVPIIQDGWLKDYDIQVDEAAIMKLINRYAQEAGVRSLERSILGMCREIALRVMMEDQHTFHITDKNIDQLTKSTSEQSLETVKQKIGFLQTN